MITCIKGGRIIDPLSNIDSLGDLYIKDNLIEAIVTPHHQNASIPNADQVIDASGLSVIPGIVDLKVRVREPGYPHKGSIESETKAASKGGITSLSCPSDTKPCIDNRSICERILSQAKEHKFCDIYPLGALTVGLEGQQLSDMISLAKSGCVGLTQALSPIEDMTVLRNAYLYAATFDLPIFIQPENLKSYNGCAHEGIISARLGLPPIPDACETMSICQNLILIEETGVRAHFTGISLAKSVDLISEAQRKGLPVTADVSMHSLHLTEMDLIDFDSNMHLRPPLRSTSDLSALLKGLIDGTIIAITSDHQPHEEICKKVPFGDSEPGMSALETLLSLGLHLVDNGRLTLQNLIATLTTGPSSILQINKGSLKPGKVADICIFDPSARWEVTPQSLISMGKNSAFMGWDLPGVVKYTIKDGHVVYSC